jgi:hypothetical protein
VSGLERIYAVLPVVVLVFLGAGFVLVFRERAAARRVWTERRIVDPDLAAPPRDPPRSPTRPWASPWLWLGVGVGSAAFGLALWPGTFGASLLFLSVLGAVLSLMAWTVRARRLRREHPVDPRSNGHARRDDPRSFGSS